MYLSWFIIEKVVNENKYIRAAIFLERNTITQLALPAVSLAIQKVNRGITSVPCRRSMLDCIIMVKLLIFAFNVLVLQIVITVQAFRYIVVRVSIAHITDIII
jgi:hypothetical protein